MSWSSVLSSLQLCTRRFTDRAIQVVNVAGQQAAQRGEAAVTADHVLLALALVRRGPGRMALEHLGLDLAQEREAIAAGLAAGSCGELAKQASPSAAVEQLVDEAVAQARALGHDYVGTEHLALALLTAGASRAGEFIRSRGISADRLREAVVAVLSG
jgi:ATP-dependent Clp protease ATP-binding subunit ClpC